MSTKKNPQKNENQKVLVVIALAVIMILYVFLQLPKEEPVIADQTNTEVFTALLKGGIASSNTIIHDDTVKVTYQLPSGMERENAELYILGVLSTLTPNKQKAVISTFSGQEKLGNIEVSMTDIMKYKNKEITLDQFKALFRIVNI